MIRMAICSESDAWREVYGAGRQLLSLEDRFRAALPEGIDFLYLDPGQVLTFLPAESSASAADIPRRLARIGADMAGVVTISAISHAVSVRQLVQGLYRAPNGVIGIPGVNSYQSRINRYYGLDSPSTVPTAESVAGQQHFGQVIDLTRTLIAHERESRQIVPFYECLPFVERCGSCRVRPAERLIDDLPVCGVCERKRASAELLAPRLEQGSQALDTLSALIFLRVPGMAALLEKQRTPAGYRLVNAAMANALRRAANGSGARILWQSGADVLLAASAANALEAVSRAFVTFTALARGSLRETLPLYGGVAVGDASPRVLYATAKSALADAIRLSVTGSAGNAPWIGLRVIPETPLTPRGRQNLGVEVPHLRGEGFRVRDSETPLYSPENLPQLQSAARTFAEVQFPARYFDDLPAQLARQTAAMYYVYGRTRLDADSRRRLDALEEDWGKDTIRFYQALSDVLGLQTFIARESQARS